MTRTNSTQLNPRLSALKLRDRLWMEAISFSPPNPQKFFGCPPFKPETSIRDALGILSLAGFVFGLVGSASATSVSPPTLKSPKVEPTISDWENFPNAQSFQTLKRSKGKLKT
ncbi:hypothetical protein, partial [Zarconia navalis]|uniref:hypothetical protein n=1 Tax=Zarconia navalis TaxID=2992134 RepID=UPI0021F88C73